MNTNIDLNTLINKLIPFAIIIFAALYLNLLIYLFLPKAHFTYSNQETKVIEYVKYKFKENLEEKKTIKTEKKIVESKKEYKLISNIVLKMIYQEENNNGWVVISEKSSNNSSIIGVNEKFKNYLLERIYDTYVVFSKNEKEYKLPLDTQEQKTAYTQIDDDNTHRQNIKKIDDQYQLNRKLIDSYTKDSRKIWKEISIKEVRFNGKIDGFKITKIKDKSVFKELGLQKNDIIKSVNNITLKSYADAFSLYKKLNKVKNMKFVIMRDNQEVELDYEIK